MTPDDRVSQHPNLAFDISMTDIFAALCHGAALVPVQTRRRPHDARALHRARKDQRVEFGAERRQPDGAGRERDAGQPRIAAPDEFLRRAAAARTSRRDLRGAARSARAEHLWPDRSDDLDDRACRSRADDLSSTIAACRSRSATPIPGMDIVLAGGAHEDEGEIVITGPQLAEGYWQDEEKTAAVFRDVATPAGSAARLLHRRLGGTARRPELFFRERIDFQVKVLGYRVELDEVAAAIRDCGWPVAVVLQARRCAGGRRRRDARTARSTRSALRAALGDKIEPHAVPAAIVADSGDAAQRQRQARSQGGGAGLRGRCAKESRHREHAVGRPARSLHSRSDGRLCVATNFRRSKSSTPF